MWHHKNSQRHTHTHTHIDMHPHKHIHIDWWCFYYFVRNSLVPLLEPLCVRIFSWFVEKKFHTAFTGQSTHEDLVQKSGLPRISFDKSCLQRILFRKNPDLRRMFFIRNLLLNHSGMHFIWSFWFCLPSTNTLVVKLIRTPILSDLNDTMCTKQ